jgi:hypothetical protein
MKKTQHRKRVKLTKTRRLKKRGGSCGCGAKSLPKFNGGYGAASYQGGLDKYISPLNGNVGTVGDPVAASNITQERFEKFVGGRKSRRRRGTKRGGFSPDFLLGESVYSNNVLSAGTSIGGINAARGIYGQNALYSK